MYITGELIDFSSRLHQLPTGMSDLASFSKEGKSYSALTELNEREKWNLEYSRKVESFTLTGMYIEGVPFS